METGDEVEGGGIETVEREVAGGSLKNSMGKIEA
jgi:hypothetical protein